MKFVMIIKSSHEIICDKCEHCVHYLIQLSDIQKDIYISARNATRNIPCLVALFLKTPILFFYRHL